MDETAEGFDVQAGTLPLPPVPVSPEVKATLMKVTTAMIGGSTPEEIAGFLEGGFPGFVEEALARPLEGQEMSDHVDLILATLQSPALAAA